MKKFLIFFLFLLVIIPFNYAQSSEGRLFEITSRVKFFLSVDDAVNLEGTERYIHIGLLGSQGDVDELVGYMDRYVINDKDMTIKVGGTISEEMVDYYKFFLDPLYDANDFQSMLEMFKVNTFFIGKEEHPVKNFSNIIYASIKSKKS